VAMDPQIFGDAALIKKYLSEFMEELRQSPRAEGEARIYTHGEKEVVAIQKAMEEGIPVNDNTMRELAELCEYLGMDFSCYFDNYQVAEDEKMFRGNY